MGLSLKDLEEVVAPLAHLGKGEITFTVGEHTATLRSLSPEEEVETQRYARSVIGENETVDEVAGLEFVDKFMIRVLSYALIQFNHLEFRDVTFVETDKKLPNGTPVRIYKHEALVPIVTKWSRSMRMAMWRKWEELVARVEREADALIEFDDVDYDIEISRLEERLADLKERKIKHDVANQNLRQEVSRRLALSRMPQTPHTTPAPAKQPGAAPAEPFSAPIEDATRTLEGEELPNFDPAQVVPPRRTLLQNRAPQAVTPPPPQAVPQQAPPPPRAPTLQQALPPQDLPPDPLADVQSSFGDALDPQTLEQENLRLLEMRARRFRQPPPHMQAREASKDLQAGLDALPDQGPPAPAPRSQSVDPTVNPNFRPPSQK